MFLAYQLVWPYGLFDTAEEMEISSKEEQDPLNTDQLLSEWKLSLSAADLLQESPSVHMQTPTLLPCSL